MSGEHTTPREQVVACLDCDTERLYGSLLEAATYLMEIHALYPDATLEENWTGYEDMDMRFTWWRDETDEEEKVRLKHEATIRENMERARKRDAAEAKEKKEYLRLKHKFG